MHTGVLITKKRKITANYVFRGLLLFEVSSVV
jgi:hypothetical protein